MLANDWAVYFRTIRGIYMNSFTALIFLVIINGIFTVTTIFYCYYTWVRNENKLFWIEPTLLPSFGFIFFINSFLYHRYKLTNYLCKYVVPCFGSTLHWFI